MKLLQSNLLPNQPGTVTIVPEDLDDLWLLYNLIAPGDVILSETTRKVSHSAKGNGSTRIRLQLQIKITDVTYEKDSPIMRVKGKNISENPHVAAGSFHTVQIENNRHFLLTKKLWDSESLNSLRKGSNKTPDADLAAVLMHETTARVYLVGKTMTTLCENIEVSPGNKRNNGNIFFEKVFRAFVKHIDFEAVKCVLIGSSGSIKDDFRSYLLMQGRKLRMKQIEDNKSRLALVDTGENFPSLREVLQEDRVMNLIKDRKAAMEIQVFKKFSEMLSGNPDRACYGLKNVEVAHGFNAIETLLISEDLVKSAEIERRRKYVELVKSVKDVGGKALVYSAKHVFGEQLSTLTGIAAILRFPLPDLDDMVM